MGGGAASNRFAAAATTRLALSPAHLPHLPVRTIGAAGSRPLPLSLAQPHANPPLPRSSARGSHVTGTLRRRSVVHLARPRRRPSQPTSALSPRSFVPSAEQRLLWRDSGASPRPVAAAATTARLGQPAATSRQAHTTVCERALNTLQSMPSMPGRTAAPSHRHLDAARFVILFCDILSPRLFI